jgi:2Fe-2S ferredoxin
MGGSNPYIRSPKMEKPRKPFKVKYLPMNIEVEVRPEAIPYGDTGLPGSVLDIALHHGVEIEHVCGGVAACSTCHVHIKSGGDTCNSAEDYEQDMLDVAPGVTPESRLSCQCVPNGEKDLVVEVPGWNRNLVREGQT